MPTKKPKDIIERHSRQYCGDGATCSKRREEAIRKGQMLKAKMKGTGWYLRVHENLGWYFSVHCGPLTVSPGFDGSYYCLIRRRDGHFCAGEGIWHNSDLRSKDPNEAVRMALDYAKCVIQEYVDSLTEAEAALK